MFFTHMLDKIGGGVIFRSFLFKEPLTADAVCDTRKDGVQSQGFIVSESTAIIVPGSV